MAVESFLLGRNAVAYFNENKLKPTVAGTTPTQAEWATWLDESGAGAATKQADNLTDVTLNMASEMADTTTRGVAKSGFASQVAVLKNGEVTFEMRWKPEDPSVTTNPYSFTRVLIDAWENDTTVALAFLDQNGRADDFDPDVPMGTEIRTQGLAANWTVSMDKTESLRDIQRSSVTLTIADAALWVQRNLTAP